jgi:hypothetical protein
VAAVEAAESDGVPGGPQHRDDLSRGIRSAFRSPRLRARAR